MRLLKNLKVRENSGPLIFSEARWKNQFNERNNLKMDYYIKKDLPSGGWAITNEGKKLNEKK